ncbi:hypothetical protein AAG570_007609 [Ranatra chinensis]|uniref:PPM-type phosphatase domain-containing protein n=1 Tax=Ranatra chinensis TaxID=642074 RepID=A0ABD0YHW5_9HEMI
MGTFLDKPKTDKHNEHGCGNGLCYGVASMQGWRVEMEDAHCAITGLGKPSFCTRDHKPIVPSEKERIQNAGGTVMIQRVNGSLAVSRALGDYEYKNVEGRGPCEQLVSPEPEVFVQDRDEAHDEFLVLACDGIWDVMSNEAVCDYIRSLLFITEDLEGSRDNMSIVLVTFPGAPKPCPEAIQRDREADEAIQRVMRGNV